GGRGRNRSGAGAEPGKEGVAGGSLPGTRDAGLCHAPACSGEGSASAGRGSPQLGDRAASRLGELRTGSGQRAAAAPAGCATVDRGEPRTCGKPPPAGAHGTGG